MVDDEYRVAAAVLAGLGNAAEATRDTIVLGVVLLYLEIRHLQYLRLFFATVRLLRRGPE